MEKKKYLFPSITFTVFQQTCDVLDTSYGTGDVNVEDKGIEWDPTWN